MRNYELTVLFHPDLEMNLEPAVDKVKSLIESNGGKVTKEVLQGKKHLSYKLKGQEFAVFYDMILELPTTAPAKVTSALNISDEAIRHLLVAVTEREMDLAAKDQGETDKNSNEAGQQEKEKQTEDVETEDDKEEKEEK